MPSPWLRQFDPAQAGAPVLVCFPHAGGASTSYRELSRVLAPRVSTLAVQYPGRQERLSEPPRTDVVDLAREILEALVADGYSTVATFGHSFGGLVAYEMARLADGDPRISVFRMFASASVAPSTHRTDKLSWLDDDALIRTLVTLDGFDARLAENRDARPLFMPAIRGDLRAIDEYQHVVDPILNVPIDVLLGSSDPRVSLRAARGWAECTAHSSAFQTFPGGHFYLHGQEPAVGRFLEDRLWAAR